ncbi:MAG: hypothetical protein ACRD50_13075 [Candidatus Acidiferrales bacterium]
MEPEFWSSLAEFLTPRISIVSRKSGVLEPDLKMTFLWRLIIWMWSVFSIFWKNQYFGVAIDFG